MPGKNAGFRSLRREFGHNGTKSASLREEPGQQFTGGGAGRHLAGADLGFEAAELGGYMRIGLEVLLYGYWNVTHVYHRERNCPQVAMPVIIEDSDVLSALQGPSQMVARDDRDYERLNRRLSRLEILTALAFANSGGELDDEAKYLLSRYIRHDWLEPDLYDSPSFFRLIDKLSSPAGRDAHEKHSAAISDLQAQQRASEDEISRRMKGVLAQLESIDASLNLVKEKQDKDSAATHEWLVVQSLGLETSQVPLSRFIPLRIYLSETPEAGVALVSDAMNQLLSNFGFAVSDDFPAIVGSWFKKWFAKTTEAVTHPEVTERLKKVERAVELQGLNKPQAESDAAHAGAISTLIKSIEGVPDAAMQVGSILIIKVTGANGPSLAVRTLTQIELIHLENNQSLLASPGNLLQTLADACQSKGKTGHGKSLAPNFDLSWTKAVLKNDQTAKNQNLLAPPSKKAKRDK